MRKMYGAICIALLCMSTGSAESKIVMDTEPRKHVEASVHARDLVGCRSLEALNRVVWWVFEGRDRDVAIKGVNNVLIRAECKRFDSVHYIRIKDETVGDLFIFQIGIRFESAIVIPDGEYYLWHGFYGRGNGW